MSSFFARNKAQASQICEGDKYPTIGAALTALCLFCCKRCIDSNRNEQIIDSDGFKSIWRHLHAFSRATSKLLSFLVLRSH